MGTQEEMTQILLNDSEAAKSMSLDPTHSDQWVQVTCETSGKYPFVAAVGVRSLMLTLPISIF